MKLSLLAFLGNTLSTLSGIGQTVSFVCLWLPGCIQ